MIIMAIGTYYFSDVEAGGIQRKAKGGLKLTDSLQFFFQHPPIYL